MNRTGLSGETAIHRWPLRIRTQRLGSVTQAWIHPRDRPQNQPMNPRNPPLPTRIQTLENIVGSMIGWVSCSRGILVSQPRRRITSAWFSIRYPRTVNSMVSIRIRRRDPDVVHRTNRSPEESRDPMPTYTVEMAGNKTSRMVMGVMTRTERPQGAANQVAGGCGSLVSLWVGAE